MVHPAGAGADGGQMGLHRHVQLGMGPFSAPHAEDVDGRVPRSPLPGGGVGGGAPVLPDPLHVHDLGQNQLRPRQFGDTQDDGSQAPELMLRRHGALVPGNRCIPCPPVLHQGEALPLGVLEVQDGPPVPPGDLSHREPLLPEAILPPRQGGLALHPEARSHDAPGPPHLPGDGPVEEGEVGARASHRIGVEEVVGADVVLVDAPLHQAHSHDPGVEAVVVPDAGRDRGEVVDSREFHHL